jgi:hypothetical protein
VNALADMLEDVEFVDEDDFEEELADENDDKQSRSVGRGNRGARRTALGKRIG